jgi:hypothetical protein
MKCSCYFVFSHFVHFCPHLCSTNLHNSLRITSILVLVLWTADLPGMYCRLFWNLLQFFGTDPTKICVMCQITSSLVRYQHCGWREIHRKQPHLLLRVGPCLWSRCLVTRWSNLLHIKQNSVALAASDCHTIFKFLHSIFITRCEP